MNTNKYLYTIITVEIANYVLSTIATNVIAPHLPQGLVNSTILCYNAFICRSKEVAKEERFLKR